MSPADAPKTTVKEIMVHPVHTVKPEMKLREVAEFLVVKGISGAPVVDSMGRVISVIGEGLVLRLAASEGLEATVAQCLSKNKMSSEKQILTVRPEDLFSDAYKLFIKNNIHRLPVIDGNGKLMGLITRGTILKIFIEAHYGKAMPAAKKA